MTIEHGTQPSPTTTTLAADSSFGFGEADRSVLVTAEVNVNGTWVPRARSLVVMQDSDFSTPGIKVTYVSWEDLRDRLMRGRRGP